jgi:type IV pilus assembly protein PilO
MSLIDDLRMLDPKQPGNWPWPVKAGALVLLFIAIQVAAYFLFWQSQGDQIEKGRQEVEKQKVTFLDKKKLAVNLEAYKQQRVEIEQAFGALLKQLPNKSEMDALLIDINQAGLGRGLVFELFRPAPQEKMMDFYAELPIAIRITGNYHDMGAFASDVAQLPRIVTLNDVTISNDKGQLQMEATAKTFRYLDEDEIARQRALAKQEKGKKK